MQFLLALLFILVPVLTHTLLDKPYNEVLLSHFKELYSEGVTPKNFVMRRFLLYSVSQAVLHGTFSVLVPWITVQNARGPDGHTAGLGVLKVLITVCYLATINFRQLVMPFFKHRYQISIYNLLLTLMLIYVLSFYEFFEEDWYFDMRICIQITDAWVCVLFVVSLNLSITHLYMNYFAYKLFPSRYIDSGTSYYEQGQETFQSTRSF